MKAARAVLRGGRLGNPSALPDNTKPARTSSRRACAPPARSSAPRAPDIARQEIYAYPPAHYAIRAPMCRAADEADSDPDRVNFLRTVRIVRRRAAEPAAFPP